MTWLHPAHTHSSMCVLVCVVSHATANIYYSHFVSSHRVSVLWGHGFFVPVTVRLAEDPPHTNATVR